MLAHGVKNLFWSRGPWGTGGPGWREGAGRAGESRAWWRRGPWDEGDQSQDGGGHEGLRPLPPRTGVTGADSGPSDDGAAAVALATCLILEHG